MGRQSVSAWRESVKRVLDLNDFFFRRGFLYPVYPTEETALFYTLFIQHSPLSHCGGHLSHCGRHLSHCSGHPDTFVITHRCNRTLSKAPYFCIDSEFYTGKKHEQQPRRTTRMVMGHGDIDLANDDDDDEEEEAMLICVTC